MKILVLIKRVPDHDLPVRLNSAGNEIDRATLRWIINPFDEVALEEALRLKEKGIATEVIVASCGTATCNETLRTALAYGADKAVLVETDKELQSLSTAKLFAALVDKQKFDMVMCGKQGADSDAGETGPMIAALLGWAQATAVSTLYAAGEHLTATREIENGQEILELRLPAVITTDLRLNHPRYLTLKGSIEARKKEIERLSPELLGVKVEQRLQQLGLSNPPARPPGVRVRTVEELIERLRNEARVL